jgi:hypothetical protein
MFIFSLKVMNIMQNKPCPSRQRSPLSNFLKEPSKNIDMA